MAINPLNIVTDGHLNTKGKTSIISLVTIGYILEIKVTQPDPIRRPNVFEVEPIFGGGLGSKKPGLSLWERRILEDEEIITIIITFLKYKKDGF